MRVKRAGLGLGVHAKLPRTRPRSGRRTLHLDLDRDLYLNLHPDLNLQSDLNLDPYIGINIEKDAELLT